MGSAVAPVGARRRHADDTGGPGARRGAGAGGRAARIGRLMAALGAAVLGRRAGFAAAALALAVAMLGTTLPTPLYPLYQERYGFSELTITVIFAVYAAGVIAGLIL